jgi:hypothetical protein
MRHPDVAPAPLGREPERPDAQATHQREPQRRARGGKCGELDHGRLGEVEREVRRRVADDHADEEGEQAADREVQTERLKRAPAPEDRPRADERDARGEGDEHGLVQQLELRDAEVDSAWTVDRPMISALRCAAARGGRPAAAGRARSPGA